MTPALWRRRVAAFAAHRRGRVSLLIFAVVFVISMAADVVANDKPLLLAYRGRLYVPVLQRLPEQKFGADFLPTEADYGDPSVRAAIRARGLDDLAADPPSL